MALHRVFNGKKYCKFSTNEQELERKTVSAVKRNSYQKYESSHLIKSKLWDNVLTLKENPNFSKHDCYCPQSTKGEGTNEAADPQCRSFGRQLRSKSHNLTLEFPGRSCELDDVKMFFSISMKAGGSSICQVLHEETAQYQVECWPRLSSCRHQQEMCSAWGGAK